MLLPSVAGKNSGVVRTPYSHLKRQNNNIDSEECWLLHSHKKDVETRDQATEGPFLRSTYDEYAAFNDLLCYLPGSEKPHSPEADAPRAMFHFPAQHLFYIPALHKRAYLAIRLHSLLPPPTLLSPPPDSFSLWKNKIISPLNRYFHTGKR